MEIFHRATLNRPAAEQTGSDLHADALMEAVLAEQTFKQSKKRCMGDTVSTAIQRQLREQNQELMSVYGLIIDGRSSLANV